MKQRGRKSAAAVLVVDVGKRMPLRVPAELTDAQAAVWRDVVGSMSGDWLCRGSIPVLIEYARHVCRARLLESQIASFEVEWTTAPGGLERFDRMLAMADRETRAMTACARALRLTPQSQMHARTAARNTSSTPTEKPWDIK
jgi:hypothetical protein